MINVEKTVPLIAQVSKPGAVLDDKNAVANITEEFDRYGRVDVF